MTTPNEIAEIARKLGAEPADIPGLWNLPGYPELTTSQLLNVAHLEEQNHAE